MRQALGFFLKHSSSFRSPPIGLWSWVHSIVGYVTREFGFKCSLMMGSFPTTFFMGLLESLLFTFYSIPLSAFSSFNQLVYIFILFFKNLSKNVIMQSYYVSIMICEQCTVMQNVKINHIK